MHEFSTQWSGVGICELCLLRECIRPLLEYFIALNPGNAWITAINDDHRQVTGQEADPASNFAYPRELRAPQLVTMIRETKSEDNPSVVGSLHEKVAISITDLSVKES